MLKRHTIRETAVQLLYNIQMNDADCPEQNVISNFWDALFDSTSQKLAIETGVAIKHITFSYEEYFQTLQERIEALLIKLSSNDDALAIISYAKVVMETEKAWAVQRHEFLRALSLQGSIRINHVVALLPDTLSLAQKAQGTRKHFVSLAETSTISQAILMPVLGTCRRLIKMFQEMEAIENPLNFPNNKFTSHLYRRKLEMKTLQENTMVMVDGVINHLTEIDETIEKNTQNYELNRITSVDRSILRLGGYELMHTQTPTAVVIAEALKTATDFSESKSALFINGILNAISKQYRKD